VIAAVPDYVHQAERILRDGRTFEWSTVALLGLAIYLPVSVQVTLGQEYLPNRVGTASGVTLGLAVSAGGLVAPLLGLLADARGLPLTLGVLLVLPVVAFLLTRRLPETVRAAVLTP
jgi:FSR family fosmidomycin resistance protein-like MFS transporter